MKVRNLLLLAVVGMMSVAYGQSKIYVDLSKVFDGYYKTMTANLSFENRKQEVEDQLQLIKKEIGGVQEEAKKLDGDMRNELLSKEARESAARKLQACIERLRMKGQELERTRAQSIQMLRRIEFERKEELVKEILVVVNKVADEKKAVEVIEVSGKTLNSVSVYLRYPKDKEITAEVLRRLNVGHENELKTAKAELERRRAKAGATVPAVK